MSRSLAPGWRAVSAPVRTLPGFLIIGAQKAGTRSLYAWLTQCPRVGAATKKEVQFFNRLANYRRGEYWYRRHFPLRWSVSVSGEATPLMWHPHAPHRVRALLPEARLVVVLRDPVERAFSHYQQQIRRGLEQLTFGEAVASAVSSTA